MTDFFERVFGADGYSVSAADKEIYATDASQMKGQTFLVVFPTQLQQLHQLLMYARRNKIDVVPRGMGSNLVGSTLPQKSIVVSFSKMDLILERKDDLVTVQPGVTYARLDAAFSDLYLPTIPFKQAVATIGGMISKGTPHVHNPKKSIGTYLYDVEFLDASGHVRNLKTEPCGAEGTLGLITKVTLKLEPRTSRRSYKVLSFATTEELLNFVEEIKLQEQILFLFYINKKLNSLLTVGGGHKLFICYAGKEGTIVEREAVKELEEDIFTINPRIHLTPYKIDRDCRIPVSKIKDFLQWVNTLDLACYGYLGGGIFHCLFDDHDQATLMYHEVVRLKGDIAGDNGIGLVKKPFVLPETIERLKELKKLYDPFGIMNGGKIYD